MSTAPLSPCEGISTAAANKLYFVNPLNTFTEPFSIFHKKCRQIFNGFRRSFASNERQTFDDDWNDGLIEVGSRGIRLDISRRRHGGRGQFVLDDLQDMAWQWRWTASGRRQRRHRWILKSSLDSMETMP